jgi:hypothetical protein
VAKRSQRPTVRPDNPRLLARNSARSYIEIDPDHPAYSAGRAWMLEPEPVPPSEVDALNHRVQRTLVFKAMVAAATDELAIGATRVDQRRLRAIRHDAAGL